MILVYFIYGVALGLLARQCLRSAYPKTLSTVCLIGTVVVTNLLFV